MGEVVGNKMPCHVSMLQFDISFCQQGVSISDTCLSLQRCFFLFSIVFIVLLLVNLQVLCERTCKDVYVFFKKDVF